ncbi:hypothetical protein SKAU_G00198890 [Synaphobranchus kaupii]|uniref:Uncharacterized protein n=1 Tax=Synaphobranchus kaupii TaxID=118154 RepID=A0A9Q1FFF2_SYNKA|nr:hypothetical protein SKAU_G00198890 [Synaphobranchus kaupii]
MQGVNKWSNNRTRSMAEVMADFAAPELRGHKRSLHLRPSGCQGGPGPSQAARKISGPLCEIKARNLPRTFPALRGGDPAPAAANGIAMRGPSVYRQQIMPFSAGHESPAFPCGPIPYGRNLQACLAAAVELRIRRRGRSRFKATLHKAPFKTSFHGSQHRDSNMLTVWQTDVCLDSLSSLLLGKHQHSTSSAARGERTACSHTGPPRPNGSGAPEKQDALCLPPAACSRRAAQL